MASASIASAVGSPKRADHRRLVLLLAGIALCALAVIACGVGAVHVPLSRIVRLAISASIGDGALISEHSVEAAILAVRLPRIVLAIAVGAILGGSGAIAQGLFRNPLADPTLIGVSAGSALGGAVAVLTGLTAPWLATTLPLAGLSLAAFVGGILATIAVHQLGRYAGHGEVTGLVLAGIIVNAFCMALVGLAIFRANDAQLRALTFWNLGSLGAASWGAVICVGVVLALFAPTLPWLAAQLDLLALGERNAVALGGSVSRLRTVVLGLTALWVGATVAVCGIVSFVGLVVPHLCRLLVGSRHALLVPACMLGGALLLLGADLIARTLVAPSELPLGVVTALIGAPTFAWLLIRQVRLRGNHV